MASLNMTSFASALKVHYTPQRVENMVYKNNPLLAMIKKYETFGGKNLPIPIRVGIPQGGSATFATANANKTASIYKDFVLTRVSDYALATIENETLLASKGDSNAFMEAATSEIDGAIMTASRSLAVALYRSSSGSIGRAGSLAAQEITLLDPESVTNFEVNQRINASATDGGGSLRVGVATITAVDRDLGKLTYTGTITALAANDFLIREGDYDVKLSGLSSWLPAVSPTNVDSFFSVNRFSDPTRLAGIRFDGSAMPIEEALISAASRVAREGGNPDTVFMSYSKYSELEKSLSAKVVIQVDINPQIGFRAMQINGPRGPLKIIADQNCPSDVCYMLQMDTWKLYSLGKAPQISDTDGMKMLRESNEDAVTVRIVYYAQLGCVAPGWNATVKLS